MTNAPAFIDTMLVPVPQTDGLGATGQVDLVPVGEPLPTGGLSDVVAQPPSYDAPPLPSLELPVSKDMVRYTYGYTEGPGKGNIVVYETMPDGSRRVVYDFGVAGGPGGESRRQAAEEFAGKLQSKWLRDHAGEVLTVDPSLPRDQQLGAITRSQWELFERQGRPLENWLFDTTAEPVSASLREAAARDAAEQLRIARSGVERRMQRFNMGLTEEQRLAAENSLAADVGLARATAANTAVKSRMDANDKLLNDLYALGRGVASGGSAALGSADALETRREVQFNNDMAAYEARKQAMIGQGFGLAGALLLS